MTIAKALKKVARLKGELVDLKGRAKACVSMIAKSEDEKFPERLDELLDQISIRKEAIMGFKSKIMKVNIEGNMFEKILRVGELKDQIVFLNELDIKQGHKREHWSSGEADRYSSQMTVTEKSKAVAIIQTEIEQITDELDDFNATTQLDE